MSNSAHTEPGGQPGGQQGQEQVEGATPRTVDWSNPRVAAILDAAAKCFARKGFASTTLAEIGKELNLRKSIVHYYFASKAALIHEVQSYTSHKYLDRVKEAIRVSSEGSRNRAMTALKSLWESRSSNIALNIETWSASRNDPELKRRAGALQKEKRKLVAEGIAAALGPDATEQLSRNIEPLSTLIMSVVNGLSVWQYIEGDEAKTEEAYGIFLYLLRLGIDQLEQQRSTPQQ